MTADTSGNGWGLGLEMATLPCGTIVGHGGGTPGYRTISFHTLDGTRQVTVDWTDWGTDADATPAALALMTTALCPSSKPVVLEADPSEPLSQVTTGPPAAPTVL
ncbi:hypothetical protein GCM10010269_25210 [Streptomyces humidus]|uniref:Uncharacterized protein n=2 Tax=Streptomyces humidus TaxID=52259 RepID=A0A918L356_9ACTN|nr:hypothetical protein GCM10010269_25210 [Streptomyces humidus]